MSEEHERNSVEKEARNDPGAVKYGNFANYYQFNPPCERLRLFSFEKLPRFDDHHIRDDGASTSTVVYALDIGCNSGNLTHALHEKLQQRSSNNNIHLLGIDIDDSLVDKATHLHATCQVDNLLPEPDARLTDGRQMLSFQQMDIMSLDGQQKLLTYMTDRHITRFNVVFCFSITMWIHINHGDEGLKAFLRYVCSICDYLVIEPQEWKSYKSAVRRCTRHASSKHHHEQIVCEVFPKYDNLKIREGKVLHVIEQYLVGGCKMELLEKTAEKTHWGRTILLLRKCNLQK